MQPGGPLAAQDDQKAGSRLALVVPALSTDSAGVESRLRALLELALTIGRREGLLGQPQGQAGLSSGETSPGRRK